MHALARRTSGFTVIELLIVLAVTAVVLSLAVPSFTGLLAKKRVEGATSELATDLQYTRSEAVQRNAQVRITFGTGCYVIHLASATAASCTQTTKTITPTDAELKTVQLQSGSTASFSTSSSNLSYIQFNPQLGDAAWDGTDASAGTVDINSSAGSWQLRVTVIAVGRTRVCSPNGSIKSYNTSCS